jgi:hypothetical protein
MAQKQADVDFFRPLWRRVLVTAFCACWFAWEAFGGIAFAIPGWFALEQHAPDQLWMIISGAALAYCVWNFILHFPQEPPAGNDGGTTSGS